MLEVSGGNHHAVDVVPRQHVFGVLITLRLKMKHLFDLRGATLPSEAPKVANGHGFHREAARRQLRHVNMAVASLSASKLAQANTVIRSKNPAIGVGVRSNRSGGHTPLLHKISTVDE